MSYKVRMYRCEMVRDGSVNADTRKVESATDAEPIFRAIIGNSPKEHVVALFLSARGNIAGAEVISVGTLTASLIHPREIFAPALALRAACFSTEGEQPVLRVECGKGGKPRTVPVHPELEAALRLTLAYRPASGELFTTTRFTAWRWVQRAYSRAADLIQFAPSDASAPSTPRSCWRSSRNCELRCSEDGAAPWISIGRAAHSKGCALHDKLEQDVRAGDVPP
mgnify:CR=1 FL=1